MLNNVKKYGIRSLYKILYELKEQNECLRITWEKNDNQIRFSIFLSVRRTWNTSNLVLPRMCACHFEFRLMDLTYGFMGIAVGQGF
jgi:hypothetical protein